MPDRLEVSDTFSDGDFTAAPAWIGDASTWTVAPLHGDSALRTDGREERDTLTLALSTAVSYGRWSLRFAYEVVNLSSFNGVRIYLAADAVDLAGPVRGYYLQIGTNNTDEVRLYRQDGDPAASRAELGRSMALATGDSGVFSLEVVRDANHRWTVHVDGQVVLTAIDSTYVNGRAMGFWVKHTAATRAAYYFDDVHVAGTAGPPETTPPALTFVDQRSAQELDLFFSEPLDLSSAAPTAFVAGGRTPVHVEPIEPAVLRLHFDQFVEGEWLLVRGVSDRSGNALSGRAPIAALPAAGDLVVNEILFHPRADPMDGLPDQPEYLELFNRSPRSLSLHHLFRTRRPDERQNADTLRIGARAALAPGGYALVFAGLDAGGTRPITDAFPSLPIGSDRLHLVSLPRAGLGLANDEDIVKLHRRDGILLDSVGYEATWHHPGLAGRAGVALERLDSGTGSADPLNWTSSTDPEGGTPGRANARRLAAPASPSPEGLRIEPSPFSVARDGFTVIGYRLRAPAAVVAVRIFDAAGRHVRELDAGRWSGSEGRLVWNGLGDGGRPLPAGAYVVWLEAVDAAGGAVERHRGVVVLVGDRP